MLKLAPNGYGTLLRRVSPWRNGAAIIFALLGLIQGLGCSSSIQAQPKSITVTPTLSTPTLTLPNAAEVRRDPADGTLQTLKAPNLAIGLDDNAEFHALINGSRWEEATLIFLSAISAQLRLKDPRRELRLESLHEDGLGFHHLKFRQIYRDLPVWGKELQVHWRGDGSVYLVSGHYVPTPENVDITPRVGSQAALDLALESIGKPGMAATAVPLAELGVYSLKQSKSPVLAYRAMVPAALARSWQIMIDANDGRVLDKTQVLR